MCSAVSGILSSSGYFQDRANDIPVVVDEIIEKDAPWDLRNLTAKNDCERSCLQRIQALYQNHDLMVQSDVQFAQSFIKDTLAALVSRMSDKKLLEEYKKTSAAEKIELNSSLEACNDKLASADLFVQKLIDSEDTLDGLAIKLDIDEATLKIFEEHVRFLEGKVAEKSIHLLAEDATATGYQKLVVVLEKEVAGLSADVKRLTAQSVADKDLLDGVRTTLVLHKTASQKCISAFSKERKRLLVDKAVFRSTE